MTELATTRPLERAVRAKRAVASLNRDWQSPTGDLRPALLRLPGPRADLKRCLGQPPSSPAWDRAWGHLIDYLPEPGNAPGQQTADEERAFVTVAAMICAQTPAARARDLQPDPAEQLPRNLGASLATGVATRGLSSRDAGLHRLILLSRQNTDGIHRLLPRTVQHLRGSLVPLDWARLIDELARWRRAHRDIAKWWIQDYHRTLRYLETRQQSDTATSESETP